MTLSRQVWGFGTQNRSDSALLRMAVNFNDPACGFSYREVVDFINKQILQNGVSPHFFTMQTCESWGEMEKLLQDILRDSAVSEDVKRACAWSALALGMRFAEWQKQDAREKVKKLQEQLEEQKLFTNVLVGMVKRMRDMQGREMEKAQFHLQQILVILRREEAQPEVLRNELRVGSSQSQKRRQSEEEDRRETQGTRYACFCSGCNKLLGKGGGSEGLRPGRGGESGFCMGERAAGSYFSLL